MNKPRPLTQEEKYNRNLEELHKTEKDLLQLVDMAISELYSYKRDTQAECLLEAKNKYLSIRG